MAGHSKWSQIKRQKGVNDAEKSGIWGKLAKRIAVESKQSGGETSAPSLRSIIEIAKRANMPKENIERAIGKGISTDAEVLETIPYETYGPGGVAIVIEALTDSRNRTAQEIKHLLGELGLTLAAPGSALWTFEKTQDGYVPKTTITLPKSDKEQLMEILEKVCAHDYVENVYTNAG